MKAKAHMTLWVRWAKQLMEMNGGQMLDRFRQQTCSDTQSSLGHWHAFKVCNKRLISSLSVPFFCICDGGLVTITFSGEAFYLLWNPIKIRWLLYLFLFFLFGNQRSAYLIWSINIEHTLWAVFWLINILNCLWTFKDEWKVTCHILEGIFLDVSV